MKKFTVIASAFALAVALAGAELIYPASMVVTDVRGDVVTMETATGHIYEMDGAEDWSPGDLAALIMWNNGTPDDVTDDVIISARYSGFWLY